MPGLALASKTALVGVLSVVFAAGPTQASLGRVTHNGVEMPVKAAVAVWRAKRAELTFFLLPAPPTPEELSLLQSDVRLDGKYAEVNLRWTFRPEAVPDPAERWVTVAAYQVAGESSLISNTFAPPEFHGTLKGNIKIGEPVTLTSKDQYRGDQTISLDIQVTAKVLEPVERKP